MAGFQTKTWTTHDDYMTPKSAWANIKHLIPPNKIIYEPFYGDGQSGKDLEELLPNNVIIHEDVDFYHYSNVFNYDIIISNPPFSSVKTVLNHLKELHKPFILIMPQSKINTNYFRENFSDNHLQIIIPRKRIQFTKLVDGKVPEDYKSVCNFDCFYYCWKMNFDRDIIFLDE